MNAIQTLLTEHIDIWTDADTEKKSGRGRSSGNAASVYGIKKLRELILELAVRGKLIPQDANDEPASELLKRIQAEKTRLVAEGKIKQGKPLPPISDEEQPFALPQGWEWQRLANLCDLGNGDRGKNYPNKSALVEAGIPFVNAGHLQNGQIDKSQMTFITKEHFSILGGGKFRENDILFCLRGSLGKSAIVKGLKEGAIASSLVIVRLSPKLDISYFVNYFDSPLSSKMVKKYDNGTAQPNLSSADLAKFLVPLPPLSEQHRIVAKVDELMALCDQLENQHTNAAEAHEQLVSQLLATLTQSHHAADFSANWQRIAAHFDTLFTTEASIDALKQTLLQLAVMGKLVPQDQNDEPASELLNKIAAEKVRLIKEGKIKKDKPLQPITEGEKPFELPQGWEFVRLATIINMSSGDGLTSESMDKTGVVPVFGGNGVTGYHSQFNTEEPTLVIGRVGFYCGSIHLTPCHAWITDNALRVKFSKENIAINFLYWLLTATNLKENDSATAQPLVTGRKIYPIVIGLPPLAEQYRIVAKVDELMTLCEQLKTRITAANQLQQKLADVLVEQALI